MILSKSFALLVPAFPSFTSGQNYPGKGTGPGKGIGPDDVWILCDDEYCHPTRAECVWDANGDSSCECIGGWRGDGRECNEDIDECAENNPCPQDGGFCVNRGPWELDHPRWKCGCIPGYKVISSDEHGATACTSDDKLPIITECINNIGPEVISEQECTRSCPDQGPRKRGNCEKNNNDKWECVCNDGYAYNTTLQDCLDIDECKCGDPPCPLEAEGGFCVDYDPDHPAFQKYKCGCLPGYEETDTDIHGATACQRVVSPANCANNNCCDDETCIPVDSERGYECQCNKRFPELCCGAGVSTPPAEPCNSECKSEGQYCDEQSGKCKCETGYFQPSGLGGTCKRENECNNPNNVCDINAICVELTPGFTCICKQGYEGVGFEGLCNKIDPTASPTKSPTRGPSEDADAPPLVPGGPTVGSVDTDAPSVIPGSPTAAPVDTAAPSVVPDGPTAGPVDTAAPSVVPDGPTAGPVDTAAPSTRPTKAPTNTPTKKPTITSCEDLGASGQCKCATSRSCKRDTSADNPDDTGCSARGGGGQFCNPNNCCCSASAAVPASVACANVS